MDLSEDIARHRAALLHLLALVVRMVGAPAGRLAALRLLRPAEAAARRLIVVLARGLTVAYVPSVFCPAALTGAGERRRAFALFDPARRVRGPVRHVADYRGPQISLIDEPRDVPAPPARRVDAADVLCRVEALERALRRLPAAARRLARWRARGLCRALMPLRAGRPPGTRARGRDEIDAILRDCHDMALYALEPPNTS